MVNAQHIRIGNWLYSKLTNRKFQVTAEDIVELNADPFTCEYIPLSPGILEATGFRKSGENYSLNKLTISLNDVINHDKGRTYFNSWAILEQHPAYLHQLQNLYHALTGEELSISLK